MSTFLVSALFVSFMSVLFVSFMSTLLVAAMSTLLVAFMSTLLVAAMSTLLVASMTGLLVLAVSQLLIATVATLRMTPRVIRSVRSVVTLLLVAIMRARWVCALLGRLLVPCMAHLTRRSVATFAMVRLLVRRLIEPVSSIARRRRTIVAVAALSWTWCLVFRMLLTSHRVCDLMRYNIISTRSLSYAVRIVRRQTQAATATAAPA